MKSIFVFGGAIVLLVDLFSYNTKISSSLPLDAFLAVSGTALLFVGLFSKKENVSPILNQPNYSRHRGAVRRPAVITDLRTKSDSILRTIPDQNAFYFYKKLHYYLDVRAKNLSEFFEELKSIDVDSVAFHVSRGDFKEWFRTTLCDADLTQEISTVSQKTSGEELRNQVVSIVQTRLSALSGQIAT